MSSRNHNRRQPVLLKDMPSSGEDDSDRDVDLQNNSRIIERETRNRTVRIENVQVENNNEDINSTDDNNHNNDDHGFDIEEIEVTADELTYIENQLNGINKISDVPEQNVFLRSLVHYREHIRATEKYEQIRLDAILEALPTLEEFESKKNFFVLIHLQSHPLGRLYMEFLSNKCVFRGRWVERLRRDKNSWKEAVLPFQNIPLPDVKSFEKYMDREQRE